MIVAAAAAEAAAVFVHLFPSRPIRHIRCDLTSWADSSVTLACGGRVSSPACLVSFWTCWLKPLTRRPFLTPSASLFICLFQTLLPFPFLLPLCIPWTLSFCFVLCVVILRFSPSSLLAHPSVFLTFSCSGLLERSVFLPPCISCSLSPVNLALFFLGPEWMVFLRKSAAHSCRARGPECHRSRLIYPPPLSSCYAWSLNFPFLLFFPCFFSQIPPLVLPDPPHPPSISHFSMQPSLSCRT